MTVCEPDVQPTPAEPFALRALFTNMGNYGRQETPSRRAFGLRGRSIESCCESTNVIEPPISVSSMDIETQLAC